MTVPEIPETPDPSPQNQQDQQTATEPAPAKPADYKATEGRGTSTLDKALRDLQGAAPGITPETQYGLFLVSFDAGMTVTGVELSRMFPVALDSANVDPAELTTMNRQLNQYLRETPEKSRCFFVQGQLVHVFAGGRVLDIVKPSEIHPQGLDDSVRQELRQKAEAAVYGAIEKREALPQEIAGLVRKSGGAA